MNERYPKELEKRQKRVQALQEALSNGVNTELDLQRLQAQVGMWGGDVGSWGGGRRRWPQEALNNGVNAELDLQRLQV